MEPDNRRLRARREHATLDKHRTALGAAVRKRQACRSGDGSHTGQRRKLVLHALVTGDRRDIRLADAVEVESRILGHIIEIEVY